LLVVRLQVNSFGTDENQADPAVVKPRWNPKGKIRDTFLSRCLFLEVILIFFSVDWIIDGEQIKAVKLALHLSTAPPSVVCREEEQNVVLEFCKGCVEQKKAGSLYICGCPGTGKSLSMEKVKEQLLNWAKEVWCNCLFHALGAVTDWWFPHAAEILKANYPLIVDMPNMPSSMLVWHVPWLIMRKNYVSYLPIEYNWPKKH